MAIPRIFLDKQTGKIRTALFSNGIEELFDVLSGKLKLLREVVIAYVTAGRVLDYSTRVGPLTVKDQSGESNDATLYSGRGATMDAAANTITYATGYGSAERTATVWMRVDVLGARTLNGATGTFTFTPTATGIWEQLSDTQTVSGDLSWTAGSDCDIGDLTCATEHWTHDDWSNPTGDTSNGKTIVDSGANDDHGTCTGCAGFTSEGIDPEVAGIVGLDDYVWFDGTSDYINKTTDLPITNTSEGFDIEFDIFSYWAASYRFMAINNSSLYRIEIVGTQLSVYMGGGAAAVTRAFFNIGGTLKLGSFQTFRITYDGSAVVSLYLDGSIFGSMTLSGAINTPVTSVRVGASAAGTFTGSIKNLTFGSWIAEGNGVTSNEWGGATVNGTPITVGQKRATIPQTADRNWNKYIYPFYTSDFSAGVDDWGKFSGTLDGNIDGIGGLDDNLRFVLDTSTGLHRGFKSGLLTIGEDTLVSMDIYIPSSNVDASGVDIIDAIGTIYFTADNIARDVWVSVSGNATAGNEQIRFNVTKNGSDSFTGNGTDVVYFRNIKTTDLADTPALISASDADDQIDAYGTAILEPRLNNQQLNLFGEGEYSLTADSDSLDVTTAATWEAWGNFYGAPSITSSVLSKWGTGKRAYRIVKIGGTDGADQIRLQLSTDGVAVSNVQAPSGIIDGTQHLVISFETGTMNFYVNGALIHTATPAVTIFASDASLYLGEDPEEGTSTLTDKIGSAKIYNVALTADEVLQNFNAQKSKYGL